MQQVAQELSRLLEFPVVYHRRSPSEQRAWLLADGASPLLADVIIGLDALFEASALAERTFTVEQLTGHPPRSLTDWLSEKLERFRRSTDKPR